MSFSGDYPPGDTDQRPVPGLQIDVVTNDNIILNVFNNLPVPILLSS